LWADDARVAVYAVLAKAYVGYPYPGVDQTMLLPVPGVLVACVAIGLSARGGATTDAVGMPELLEPAVAARRLGISQAAVMALAGGTRGGVTAVAVEGWADDSAADPDHFAQLVTEARRAETTRREAQRLERRREPRIPDYHQALTELMARESAVAHARIGRWRAEVL
jgi:hypothetical protein